jgi:hypothetical protein
LKIGISFVLALSIVVSGLVSAQTPTPSPGISPSVQPTVTSTPSGWKKTVTTIDSLGTDLEKLDKAASTIVFTLLKLVVLLLSLIIIQRLLLLIFNRSPELIIENFSNSSGNDELDKVLTGFSQLARQGLVGEIEGVRRRVQENIRGVGPDAYRSSDKTPLPQATSAQQLNNLLVSLTEITPGQIDSVLQLINVIFPPYGTKVISILQHKGDTPGRVGITFEIKNILGKQAPKLYTIWESPTEQSANSQDNSTKAILKDRYVAILKAATRWLALELSRREMIAAVPRIYLGSKQKYRGQIHNFFGVLNLASAPTHGTFFYELAIEDLHQAIELAPDWYQPYENLANTYSALGRDTQGKEGVAWQRKAVLRYTDALERVQDENVKHRIQIGKATSQLLTSEKILIEEAKQEIQKVEMDWDAAFEKDARFLYNLASWYALAKHQGSVGFHADKTARRYLAYSLVRDNSFWYWAGKDKDLESIHDGLEDLKFELSKKLRQLIELPKLEGKEFTDAMDEVLKKINWLN